MTEFNDEDFTAGIADEIEADVEEFEFDIDEDDSLDDFNGSDFELDD